MSPTFDMGADFNTAQEEDKKQRTPLPPGPYQLRCTECRLTETQKGRPQALFVFETCGSSQEEYNGKNLKYWAPSQ